MHRPTVGSSEEALSYERGTPVSHGAANAASNIPCSTCVDCSREQEISAYMAVGELVPSTAQLSYGVCSGSEAGSYVRRIDLRITQL